MVSEPEITGCYHFISHTVINAPVQPSQDLAPIPNSSICSPSPTPGLESSSCATSLRPAAPSASAR